MDVPTKLGRSNSERKLKRTNSSSFSSRQLSVDLKGQQEYGSSKSSSNSYESVATTLKRRSSKIHVMCDTADLHSDSHDEVLYNNHMNISCINLKLNDLLIDRQEGFLSQCFSAFEENIVEHSLPHRKDRKGRSIMSIIHNPSYGMLNISAPMSDSMVSNL